MNDPDFDLYYDEWGNLVLVDAAQVRHAGVVPVRAFPMSAPADGISICAADGRELVWIEHLDALPVKLRRTLDDALSAREFVPIVVRIVKARIEGEGSVWQVETDRGPTEFRVKHEEDVRRLGLERILFTDVLGIRYLIPCVHKLDLASRRWLELFI